MFVVVAFLVAGGATVLSALLPLVVCMAMMSAMGHGGGHDHGAGPEKQ